MALDNDEKLEGMCDKCKEEVTSTNNCSRCGDKLTTEEKFINPNFDKSRFEELSRG